MYVNHDVRTFFVVYHWPLISREIASNSSDAQVATTERNCFVVELQP